MQGAAIALHRQKVKAVGELMDGNLKAAGVVIPLRIHGCYSEDMVCRGDEKTGMRMDSLSVDTL